MAENFLQYKILPKKTESESVVRLLTDLSIHKLTPIDIAEIEVTNIELKHLSYLSKTVTYEYSYRIMLGQERKMYKNAVCILPVGITSLSTGFFLLNTQRLAQKRT